MAYRSESRLLYGLSSLVLCIALSCIQRTQAIWKDRLSNGKEAGFPDHKEASEMLDGWLKRYPQYLTRRLMGKSFEGRDIYVYIVGTQQDRLYLDRPRIMLTSLVHAREPAGLTALLYTLGRLLELNEQGDPEAVYAIQTRQIYCVPFVNPDGYIANEKLANKVLRKNRRPTCDKSKRRIGNKEIMQEDGHSGVDLNRNFGLHWRPKFGVCSDEYQGDRPFSEPETQALKKLVEEAKFTAAVNFHSFGAMLTHPYNYGSRKLPEDDARIYAEIAKVFKWPKFGTAIETVGYTTSGESDDWLYATHGVISMSPEVGPESGGFWPPTSLVQGIDTRNFHRNMYVIKKAGLELGISWSSEFLRHGTDHVFPSGLKETFTSGGLPTNLLELEVRNTGLRTSAGEALNIAVSGLTHASMGHGDPEVFAVLEGSGESATQRPARLVQDDSAANGAPILAFQVKPIERRSSINLKLLLSASLEATWPMRYLTTCAVEMPLAADPLSPGAPAVCQCIERARLPGATATSQGTFKSESPAIFVRYVTSGDRTHLQKLCGAAVSATANAPAVEVEPRRAQALFI